MSSPSPSAAEGSRLRSVTDAFSIQKNALRLPNGEILIERTIRIYRDEGHELAEALVFHSKHSIVDVLGDGIVDEVMAYPLVPIPAHIGVTLFAPVVYGLFDTLFDLTRRTDFEGALFPLLAQEKRLYSVLIPTESWFQVNDPKSLQRLMDAVREETAPSPSVAANV